MLLSVCSVFYVPSLRFYLRYYSVSNKSKLNKKSVVKCVFCSLRHMLTIEVFIKKWDTRTSVIHEPRNELYPTLKEINALKYVCKCCASPICGVVVY